MRQMVQNTEAALQYLTEFVTETIRGESREAARKSIEFAFQRVPVLKKHRSEWRPVALSWIGITMRPGSEGLDALGGIEATSRVRSASLVEEKDERLHGSAFAG